MKNLLPFILLFIISFSVHALKQDDLLPPDKAFQVSANAIDAHHIRLSWKIAEGYYLYKNRITFDSEHDGVTLNRDAAIFPQGDIKDDPNFGKLEVFHNSLSVDIPLDRAAAQQDELTLKLKTRYQGCADAGLCYSPQYKKLSLTLAALPTPEAAPTAVAEAKTATQESEPVETKNPLPTEVINTTATTPSKRLLKQMTGNQALSVDQAFQLSLQGIDKKTVNARLEVTPGHHLYRDKISFQIISPEGTQLGNIRFPESRMVNDEFFGETEIYDHTIDISLPLLNIVGDTLTISTEYQGCADEAGICYPPVTQETTLSLADLPESAAPPVDNETTPSADDYFSGSFIGTLIAFFVVGLGLSLTPCIFPMIPILSGIIAGQSNLSAGKAFFLSLVYVLASASAYALIGLVFGFFGENLQSSLQHPMAIGLFAALFVVLAFSMFGFFELQMPTRIQSRLNEISSNQRSGSLIGAAIMGFLSTLIVGPCVAPALAAALTYIADSKDAVLGASALFSMGFGMGIILLVVGTLGGHLLPRAGAWMDSTKAIFGIMLLGMAIWMLSRITSLSVTMLLTGILLVSSGIYMGALDRLNEEASGWDRFWKSTGLILLFFGSTQLLGVATGSQNFLHPLQGVFTVNVSGVTSGTRTDQHAGLQFRPVKKSAELDAILEQAKQANQAVMLDFYADWCMTCKIMEKEVFNTPEIKNALKNVVVLQADVTANDEHDKALKKRFGIIGPPSIIFFNTQGEEIKTLRLIGAENLPAFRQRIQRFRSNF
ncbi:MAG: thiol:disulfide interchange protein [Thiothrix nivea]|nr:MAG: thiol:disulfide interchange protein [Thiothrix nivea]